LPISKIGGKSRHADASRFVLRRARFAAINAVEGMPLTTAMTGRAAAFRSRRPDGRRAPRRIQSL
jgi:hypothetical protein